MHINNYIDNKTKDYSSVKEIYIEVLSKFTIEDNCQIDLSILPNELKKDPELVKKILEVVYKYIPKKEEYTIKELHLEYANYLKEQLDSGYIYGRRLIYSQELPIELLSDTQFINSIIDVASEYDQAILKEQYNITPKPKVKIEKEYQRYFIMSQDLRNKGKYYMKKYEFKKAILEFEKGIEIYPYYHGCYSDKADSLIKLGRIDDAINFLKEISNSKELKNANKIYYTSCSCDATYPKYTYNIFIKIIKNHLQDAENKKARGYIYKPRKKQDY